MSNPDQASGASIETAFLIVAKDSLAAMHEQDGHLTRMFGRRNVDWEKVGQALLKWNNRWIDRIAVRTAQRPKFVYFDVTQTLSVSE